MNAASMLPPTPRDFFIHRQCRVLNRSTRKIATEHLLSQTRVRQIVERVSRWLGAMLPAQTEEEQTQEARLAQNLAAEQMAQQCEDLETLWQATTDPKFLRQKTRVIMALARLGVTPGKLETLAADATAGPLDPQEPQPAWSEDDPWANYEQALKIVEAVRATHRRGTDCQSVPCGADIPVCQSESPVSAAVIDSPAPIADSATQDSPDAYPTNTPVGDCSPKFESAPAAAADDDDGFDATAYAAEVSRLELERSQVQIASLKQDEQRLLSELAAAESNPGGATQVNRCRELLERTRHARDVLEIRLSRQEPGAAVSPLPR